MQKYKQHRTLITITCDQCGKEYLKPLSEYKRNKELERHNFCSRSCAAKYNGSHRSQKMIEYSNSEKNKQHLLKINQSYNIYEKFPERRFSYFLRNCRKRFKECTITLNDLQEQWERQNGICPYSGISLVIPIYERNHNNPIYSASVDRIDSSKGYIPGNIQFVSTCINYMKNMMSDKDTKYVCKCIAEHFYSEGTISSSCSNAA
jgi:hypothetical protein